uniref:Uncharacterized protein n=1 Tax=Nothoprocta perdicaria TaxID=30464 RepID=A0A8C6ZQL1_NOTPE
HRGPPDTGALPGHQARTPGPPLRLPLPQMEREVSAFIQASGEPRRRFQPMSKLERSILRVPPAPRHLLQPLWGQRGGR